MKAVSAAFVAGLLGVLIGSLAAQAPRGLDGPPADSPAGVLYAGPVEALSLTDGNQPQLGATVRVYEDWVLLVESGQFIPRERVAMLVAGRDGVRRGERDFGTDPGQDRPARSDTFRED